MSKAVEKASVNAPFVKSKERLTKVEAPPASVKLTFIASTPPPPLLLLHKYPVVLSSSYVA